MFQIVHFAIKHKKETSQASRALAQSIERARSNLVWMNTNYKVIVSWLEDAVSKVPPSVTDHIV